MSSDILQQCKKERKKKEKKGKKKPNKEQDQKHLTNNFKRPDKTHLHASTMPRPGLGQPDTPVITRTPEQATATFITHHTSL